MRGLIPCPLCNGEAKLAHYTDCCSAPYIKIRCQKCGLSLIVDVDARDSDAINEARAVEKWNRRDCNGNQGKSEENSPNWIYVEDGLPPIDEDVVVIAEVNMGIGSSLVKFIDSREQRTGWGRTIECWHRDVNVTRLAWLPMPKFERRKSI